MKFAAKKMWPEKSQSWDYLGEAEGIDDFALMYATDKKLDADAEFVVFEKSGANGDIQFFKVSRTEPYAIAPAEPRVESQSSSGGAASKSPDMANFEVQQIADVWRAMFGNFIFFAKVGGTAVLAFALLAWLIGKAKDMI